MQAKDSAAERAAAEGHRVYKAVPQLSRLREQVLMGDVWKQSEMSLRDRRSLLTCDLVRVEHVGLRTEARDQSSNRDLGLLRHGKSPFSSVERTSDGWQSASLTEFRSRRKSSEPR